MERHEGQLFPWLHPLFSWPKKKKGGHRLVVHNILLGFHFTSFVIRQSTIKSMDSIHRKEVG